MTTIAVPFHLDERLEGFEAPLRVDRTISPDLVGSTPWARMAPLYEEVAAAVEASRDPLVISGDCTTSMATLAGTQRYVANPRVVWIDAHGDFNTEEITESGYLGGLPLAKICGLGDLEVVERLSLTPVDPERVLLVGARDVDPKEDALLADAGIRRTTVESFDVADLPSGPLFLHLDVDVANPADLPGLHFPVPGGPRKELLIDAIAALVATGRIAAVDIGLSWEPDPKLEQIRAEYMQPILALLGGQQ